MLFRLAMILLALGAVAMQTAAQAQNSPGARRPYMDTRTNAIRTEETTGYGPLTGGAKPSGWLLCREGEVLVGVSFKRGRIIDRVLIHCAAPVRVMSGRNEQARERTFGFPAWTWNPAAMHPPAWQEHPMYPDAAAGGGGGERVTKNICAEGYAISGMAASLNVRGQIEDLAFECALLIGGFTPGAARGGVNWFSERCQPTLVFAVFPVDYCLSDTARSVLRGMPAGGNPYRHWPDDRFGVPWMRAADELQRCHQYGAVGLTFVEEGWATLTAINVVVTSLKLVCISHGVGFFRPVPPDRRR